MTKKAWEVKRYDIIAILGRPFGVQSVHYVGQDARTSEVVFYNADEIPVCFRQNETIEVVEG